MGTSWKQIDIQGLEVSAQLIFFRNLFYRLFFFPPLRFSVNLNNLNNVLLIEKIVQACSVLWGCAAHLCLQRALLLRHCCWAARLPSRCSARDQPQVSAASSAPTDSWLREKESNRERNRERKSVNSAGKWEEKGSQKKKSLRISQRLLWTAASGKEHKWFKMNQNTTPKMYNIDLINLVQTERGRKMKWFIFFPEKKKKRQTAQSFLLIANLIDVDWRSHLSLTGHLHLILSLIYVTAVCVCIKLVWGSFIYRKNVQNVLWL